MIAGFTSHRTEFERIRTLMNQPPVLLGIYSSGDVAWAPKDSPPGTNAERDGKLAELRRLMRDAGVRSVSGDRDRTQFVLWVNESQLRGEAKGVAFALRPPGAAAGERPQERVVPSIDSSSRNDYFHGGAKTIYAKIDSNWYLFYAGD
jgi:hypothetical protein